MVKDKWTNDILYNLYKDPKRFRDLEKAIPEISKKVLSSKLRKMENNNLIYKSIISKTPLIIQYHLSDFSLSLRPIFSSMYLWVMNYQQDYYNLVKNDLKSYALIPISFTLHILEKKWKVGILNSLRNNPKRISELKKELHPVSKKMLIEHLKEMEQDGLIIKNIYDENLPKVEYSLTSSGKALIPIMDMFIEWSLNYEQYNLEKEKNPLSL